MKKKLNKIEPPQKTFFFERQDGTIFSAQERNAAQCRRKFRLIGSSDGSTYYKTINDYVDKVPTDDRGDKWVEEKDVRELLKKAFEAELEKARGHIVEPVAKSLLYADPGIDERDVEGMASRR